MAYRLIVAEKPSVARDIARCLGVNGRGQGFIGTGDTRITWCVGHLVELAEPQSYNPDWKRWRLDALPMLPEDFKLQPRGQAGDQWQILRKLLCDRDVDHVVNACDAGREGELIFAYAYELAGSKAPVQRLWISAMTDDAIRHGFANLRTGPSMAPLEAAARCRSEADWLVGLNATRAMTLRMRQGGDGQLLSLGRVQTPTLALLVRREEAIEQFVPEPFWQVKATLSAEAGQWPALAVHGKGKARSDRWDTQDDAAAVLAAIANQTGVVSKVDRKSKREKSPLLYDLTTLQKEANKRFKYSAKRTLEIAQALYERHKLITYPRTDSRHLAQTHVAGIPDTVRGLDFGPYARASQDVLSRWPIKLSKRVVDDAEVSDHHAIIPTGQDPTKCGLNVDEKRVYDLVARRFLAVLMPDAVFATAAVEATVASHVLVASGRSLLEPGWRSIDPPKSSKKDAPLLPPVNKGDEVTVPKAQLHEGSTKPPRRFSEATLLGAMENAGDSLDDAELKRAMKRNGLGTPATRAAIIETLLSRTYIERESNHLVPTAQGRALINALPTEALTSAQLTGSWEARLVAMAEGGEDRGVFMADVRALAAEIVGSIAEAPLVAELRISRPADGEKLADCPRCGKDVREDTWAWRCECGVRIPRKVASRDVSERMAKTLLKDGRTKVVKGFKSKAGKAFSAALVLSDEGVKFDFPDPDALGDCPACKTPVRRRGSVWTCDTGRECPFVVFGEMSGHAVTDADVAALLTDGQSGPIEDFATRDGDAFAGVLAVESGRVVARRVDLRQAQAEAAGPVGPCPRCGEGVSFSGNRWRCRCGFSLPAEVASRPLRPQDVAPLLIDRRTPRLHGFRQKNGAVFKASLFLDDDGRVQLDFSKPTDTLDEPPPRGPPFAFGHRVDCPACLERAELDPGYVIAGRSAWGCSRWKAGCKLQLPFEPLPGVPLDDAQATRLLGKHRQTVLMKLPIGIGGALTKGRLVLDPQQSPAWHAAKHEKP